jgi:transcriptional regulator with XRE-family HTH domain
MEDHPLKRYRTAHGLTQRQLAERLGVSVAAITHTETGRRKVTAENALKWESLTGVTREDLCPRIFGRGESTEQAAA